MLSIEDKFYTPGLRWKKGEMEALGLLDDASKERLLPHIVLPTLSARDIEQQREITRDEFTVVQVGRLQRFWASRPCLIDLRFVRLDPDDNGSDAGRVAEFLVTSRNFGCKLIPVFDLRTDAYRKSALSAHARISGYGWSIRITLDDLQNSALKEGLRSLVTEVGLSALDCILVVDLADASLDDVEAFSNFTDGWLAKLRGFERWKRIIVEASAYPIKNPAEANGVANVPRAEWSAWSRLVQKDRSIPEWASFGDFGADHGHIDFSGGGRPITHLRYATSNSWIVVRGKRPKELGGDNINAVARRIVSDPAFMGQHYSAGDEFITLCAENASVGNPSVWRRANMVHHMTMATSFAGELIGAPFERAKRAPLARQLSLLSASD